jgi:hypothetical protein
MDLMFSQEIVYRALLKDPNLARLSITNNKRSDRSTIPVLAVMAIPTRLYKRCNNMLSILAIERCIAVPCLREDQIPC